jgi:farnesyl-diphosphate farnesyltransferase
MIKKSSKAFVSGFIPKVSRTFALAIKFLPPDLRHSVFSAYLLCRLADTIEDSPFIESIEKSVRLKHLKDLLISASNGIPIGSEDLTPLYKGVELQHGDDHRLLGNSAELFDVLSELPDDNRRIIHRWAGEMAGGMAEFSSATSLSDDQINALEDTEQWDRYCYYVAGTVGHMLTELFIARYHFADHIAHNMNNLCTSFGLGLQKVNTIKDVPGDMKRGVVFLPLDIMKKHGLSPNELGKTGNNAAKAAFVGQLLDITSSHLDDAIEYTSHMPERLKGVRMFLTVPVLLAQATVNVLSKYPVQAMQGPPVKITRNEVARLTTMARLYSPSNKALKEYYIKLRNKRL